MVVKTDVPGESYHLLASTAASVTLDQQRMELIGGEN